MIQYLHSMESWIETGDVNPADGEIVSQILGAGGWQGQEQRVGSVPAQNCSALSRIQVKEKKKNGVGGSGDRLVLNPQELWNGRGNITTLSIETQFFNSLLRSKSGSDVLVWMWNFCLY